MPARQTPFPRFESRREQGQESGWVPVDLGGHEVIGQLHMHLRAGPEAAGEGRHALDRLEGTLEERQLNELRLLVTELLTNSVRHGTDGDEWITLDLAVYANAIRGAVSDPGPGFEPEPQPHPHGD